MNNLSNAGATSGVLVRYLSFFFFEGTVKVGDRCSR